MLQSGEQAEGEPRLSPQIANRGVGTRILRGAGAQATAQGLRIIQQLLLVPLFLAAWGIDTYNDWLLISAGAALLATFDSGVAPHFSGELQDHFVRGDIAGYRRVARVACFSYLVIISVALLVIGIASFAIDWLAVLGVYRLPRNEAYWTLGFLVANTLLLLPYGFLGALYRARGEYDRSVIMTSINLTLQITATSILLLFRQPTAMIAGAMFAVCLIGWAIMLFDQRLRYGSLPWGFSIPTAKEMHRLSGNWAYFMAQPIAAWLTVQGPILILGHFGLPAATVAFSTARTAIGLSRQFVSTAAFPFGFELSVFMIRGEQAQLHRLLRNALSIVAIAGGLLSGFILVAGATLISVWLHGQIEVKFSLIIVLAVTAAITAPAQIFVVLLMFVNRPRLIAHAVFAYAAIGLLLGLLLVRAFGATGIAIGLGVGEILGLAGYLSFKVATQTGISGTWAVLGGTVRALGGCLLGYAIARGLALFLSPTDYLRLAIFSIAWAIVAGPAAFFILLNPEQRAAIMKRIPRPL